MFSRIQDIKGDDGELPGDFDNEIHKWALECWYTFKFLVLRSFRVLKVKSKVELVRPVDCIGIGRVALDVRLGCLGGTLALDSEPQKIIHAAKFALRNVAVLELKAPFWRYVPTPLWTRYVRNMNYFIE